MKLTKEVLEQHIDLQKEIADLEKKIKKLEKQGIIVADVVQNGYKRHAVVKGIDYVRLDKIDTLIEIYKQRKEKALKQEVEIANFITSISDVKLRRIFEFRYIEGLDWYKIQVLMGFNHEDTARKRHDRFLEKNK